MGYMFIIMGIIFIIISIYTIYKGHVSTTWPTVTGTIQNIEIKEQTETTGGMTNGKRNTRATGWKPIVKYSYKAVGNEYTGNRIKFMAAAYPAKILAEKSIKGYSIGQQIKIFHNPGKPEESVLKPGISIGSVSFLPIGIILIIAGKHMLHL